MNILDGLFPFPTSSKIFCHIQLLYHTNIIDISYDYMTPIFEYAILKLDSSTTNERKGTKKKKKKITLLKIYELNTLGKTSLQRCFTSNIFYTALDLISLFYSLNKKKKEMATQKSS